MKRNVLLILVGSRKASAINVQKTLSAWGCLVKTRLGIHDGVLDDCSDSGLLFLELVGDDSKHKELTRKLNLLRGVRAELVQLSVEENPAPARFTPVHAQPAPAKKATRKKTKRK
jgi:hypothetical protein